MEETDIQAVPDSVKKIAYSWSNGGLHDSEFLYGIEYLIRNGIIELNDDAAAKIQKESSVCYSVSPTITICRKSSLQEKLVDFSRQKEVSENLTSVGQ